MKKWEKVFWAVLCGAAFGAAGEGCGKAEYGVPIPQDTGSDAQQDILDVADGVEAIEDVLEEEAVAGAYGPPPDM